MEEGDRLLGLRRGGLSGEVEFIREGGSLKSGSARVLGDGLGQTCESTQCMRQSVQVIKKANHGLGLDRALVTRHFGSRMVWRRTP